MELYKVNRFYDDLKYFFDTLKKSFEFNNVNYRSNLYECDIMKVEKVSADSAFKIGVFKKAGWKNLDKLMKIIESLRKKKDRERVVLVLEEIAYLLFDYIEESEEPSYRTVDSIISYIEVCGLYSQYVKEEELLDIIKSIYIPKVRV